MVKKKCNNRIIGLGISTFLLLLVSSCLKLENEKVEQVYPEFDYNKANLIKIYNQKTDSQVNLKDSTDLLVFKSIMEDRDNYFLKDSIELEGKKSVYSIEIASPQDTLNLTVFPMDGSEKIELAFFDDYDSSEPNKYRAYNRFYMNKSLLDYIMSKDH